MRAVVLPRQGGKTARLLRWLVLDKRHVLIVMSMRERDRLVRLFIGQWTAEQKPVSPTDPKPLPLPDDARRIVTLDEILRGATRGMWPDPVYGIDELDQVLAGMLRGPVEIVSFSGEVEQ